MDLAGGVSPPLWTTLEARLRFGGANGKVGRCQLPCFAGSHYCSRSSSGAGREIQNTVRMIQNTVR